jgi:CubicO group peptidase (beta-lactamase class C family)
MSIACILGTAQATTPHDQIAAYLDPYISSGNFSGSILVVGDGKTLFKGSYGLADVSKKTPNRVDTIFHVASVSMQFTAATAMRLVDEGKLSLDTRIGEIVAGVPNGDKITVRELLQQDSNLPDANDLDGYDDLLKSHQTPESLVEFIRNRPPLGEPGGKSQREEHSAFNVLALIIEKKTGLSFKEAVRREVFTPLGMTSSGIDDDSPIKARLAPRMARGYVEKGAVGLEDAPAFHWSAKTGNGSAYSTIDDEHLWLRAFFGGTFLSKASRDTMLAWGEGYGWESLEQSRIGTPIYFMSGNAPGFASEAIYVPKLRTEIIIFSNTKFPMPPMMGFDIAAVLAGGKYQDLKLQTAPLSNDEIAHVVGRYHFGPDFYRPNATLELASGPDGLVVKWPGGPDAPVLVSDNHHFIDRHYWTRFSVADDPDGHATQLTYGRFNGQRIADGRPATAH